MFSNHEGMNVQPNLINEGNELEQIRTLLENLYGSASEAALVARFLQIIERRRAERSTELLERDQQLSPNWYREHIHSAYVLYVDLFCEDQQDGYKLRGLTERLKYFENLGIDLLHLLPLLDSAGDAGFAVRDFNTVNPAIGTLADLKHLIKRCHKRNMFVALDFVLNHVADTHAWAQQALTNEDYRGFFIWDSTGEPWPDVPDIFPEFAPGHWDFVPTNGPDASDPSTDGEWVWSTFYSRRPYGLEHEWPTNDFAQWDLNYSNPEVLLAMLDQLLSMANWGVDVFRLDAVPFLWKQRGTSCVGLPEGHLIVKLLRLGLDLVAPRTALLAEACQPLDQIFNFFGDGNEVQSAYHFELMCSFWTAMAGLGITDIETTIQHSQALVQQRGLDAMPPHWWVFSECHDEVSLEIPPDHLAEQLFNYYVESGGLPFRFNDQDTFGRGICGTTYTLLRGDLRKILLLWKLQITLGSTPLFYMGAELGVPNDLSYQNNPEQATDSRFVKRVALGTDWTDRINNPASTESYLYHQLARWLHWRRAHACLAESPEFFTTGLPGVLGFTQQTVFSPGFAQQQVCPEILRLVANCSDEKVTVTLPVTVTGADPQQVEVEPWQLWSDAADMPDVERAGRLIR